eukprot:gene522-633_t
MVLCYDAEDKGRENYMGLGVEAIGGQGALAEPTVMTINPNRCHNVPAAFGCLGLNAHQPKPLTAYIYNERDQNIARFERLGGVETFAIHMANVPVMVNTIHPAFMKLDAETIGGHMFLSTRVFLSTISPKFAKLKCETLGGQLALSRGPFANTINPK